MKAWLRAIGFYRGFLLTTLMPVGLGAALAWSDGARLDWRLLIFLQIGVWLAHASTNLLNDYYDHLSGADVNNPVKTPFSGGTGVIQEGLLTPKQVHDVGYLCLALSALAFVLLGWRVGWPLTALAAVGLFSGWSYTAPPFRWSYRGLGEILIGVNHGPVAVLAGYFAMSGRLSTVALWAGAVMGLWTMAIITVNQLPDYQADSHAGKRNLVVRLGCTLGLRLWKFWLDLSFATLAAGLFLGRLPAEMVLGLLLFPWAERLALRARDALSDLPTLTAACGDTIKGESLYWALLTAGAIAARLGGPGL